jgi:hypothetical protein
VFHRLSLRSPPLTDPVLPYLSLSHWRVSFFLFLFFIFLFLFSKTKPKTNYENTPRPLYNGPPSFAQPDLPVSLPAVRPPEATSETTWTVRTKVTSKASFPVNRRLSLTIISL